MRKMLMGSALLALAINCPAWAQDTQGAAPSVGSNAQTTQQTTTTHHMRHHHKLTQNNSDNNTDQAQQDNIVPGQETGVRGSEPSSTHASNIDRANTKSEVAPSLPSPQVGQNASVEQYLQAANNALDSHRSGAAQEALERAETRLLDRVSQNGINPEQSTAIMNLNEARRDLANGDNDAARRAIRDTLQSAQNMQGQNMQGQNPQNQNAQNFQNGIQQNNQSAQNGSMGSGMNGSPMSTGTSTGGQGLGAGMGGTIPNNTTNSPYPASTLPGGQSNGMMSNGPSSINPAPMPMSNQP